MAFAPFQHLQYRSRYSMSMSQGCNGFGSTKTFPGSGIFDRDATSGGKGQLPKTNIRPPVHERRRPNLRKREAL